MKKQLQSLIVRSVAGAALCASGAALADAPGWYAGAHVGANDVRSWDADVNFGGPTTPGSLKLDRGAQFGLFAGRRTENARFEIEAQHGVAKITNVSLGPVTQPASGRASYLALTANAYRTFQVNDRFTAYAGLGIGWGRASLPTLAAIGTCNCFQDASANGFVWLARAGAEYEFAERKHLFAQYTLLHIPGPTSGATPSVSYANKNVNSLAIGLRAGF